MRSLAVLLLVAGCADASAEWVDNGDTAAAKADIAALPVTMTGTETQRLLRDAPAAKSLVIEYYGTREDRLGNDEPVLFYTATFPGADVAASDFSNLSPHETAALASQVETGSVEGASVLARTCPFLPDVCSSATGL